MLNGTTIFLVTQWFLDSAVLDFYLILKHQTGIQTSCATTTHIEPSN